MDNGQPATRQEIRNVSASNGGISLVGNFKDCTIGGVQQLTIQEQINQCRNALFISDPKIDRTTLISSKGQRAPGTCEWIRKNPHYQAWLAGESRLLWVSGGPGRGKTVLSLFLNEEVEKLCQGTDDRLLFYFCQFQNEKHNNAINVLRSLIYQILEFSIEGPEMQQALEYFDTPKKTEFALSSFECLWTVLEKLSKQPGLPRIFCVIDGVDECHSSRQLVKTLYRYCKSQTRNKNSAGLRLALIGRDLDKLGAFPGIKVDPDNEENVNEDVKTFVSSRLKALARIPGFDDIRSRVEKALLEGAEGTFLWVSFVIKELSRKTTCVEILDTLQALPKGLHPVFARMLGNIDSDQRQTSALIFKWVALAERPLTLDELAAAIAVKPGDHDLSIERIVADWVKICRPFLKVHNKRVVFVHQSAKEYLLREQPDADPVLEMFRITANQGHAALAHECLDILEASAFQRTALNLSDMSWPHQSHLLNYAVLHWQNHARLASRDAKDLFNPDRPFFQQPSAVRNNWTQTYNSWCSSQIRRHLPETPLHMACCLGIIPWVEITLQRDRSMTRGVRKWQSRKTIDRTDGGPTPLGWAVASEDKDMVQILLDSGADIDATYMWTRTPLVHAVQGRSKPMVQLLLNSYDNLNHENCQGILALKIAISEDDESMARLLLDKGLPLEGRHYDLLTAAITSKHEGMVPALVEHGVDPAKGERQQ
ncbi:hypothetical protein BHE90_001900 [Fusarium euwallaceae]|uniref:Uncharacterized protein n=1 Tax=Fusarium euwallaceae TaxID=1147111 RepID=A0A430M670_9HYPO|nr:hypothetical protein BHE90_001900 [Fusarium euwallaceae]